MRVPATAISGESGIVYCLSRRKVDDTAALAGRGRASRRLPYHAGLDAATRAKNQQRFLREDGVVMVATVAFGMGIDKPDVRFVAHLDLPRSMEGYYQETGRAGRDGLPAEAWMIYGLADVVTMSQMIAQSESADERKRVERQKLESLLAYAEATALPPRAAAGRVRRGLSAAPAATATTASSPPKTWDATVPAQKALSAVYRTGQRYGSGHVIDVLRGEDSERVLSLDHDKLSTFGIGADMDDKQWRSVFRQLLAAGLLETDPEGYGTLRLTAASRGVLTGGQRGEAARGCPARAQRASSPRQPAGHRRCAASASRPTSSRCGMRCAPLRSQLAKQHGVPPYVVFHDATLLAMLRAMPAERRRAGHDQRRGRGQAQALRARFPGGDQRRRIGSAAPRLGRAYCGGCAGKAVTIRLEYSVGRGWQRAARRRVCGSRVGMKGKATSLDIAYLAGVSQATVSRALRGSPLVNEETRRRIQAAAEQLNYKVDKNASNLRRMHTGTLALLIFEDPTADESHINPFFLSMLGSITRACAQHGYDLLISFQQLSHDWHADFADSNKADGIILLGYGDYLAYRDKLEKLVAQGTRFVRWGAVLPDQPGVSIGCDNFRGGQAVAAHLLEQGCRRIAFLGDASSHYPEFFGALSRLCRRAAAGRHRGRSRAAGECRNHRAAPATRRCSALLAREARLRCACSPPAT